MQHKAVYLLFYKFTLHVSGVNHNPSSGVHKTVTTAFSTGHIFLCSCLPPTWPSYLATLEGGSCFALHLVGQLLLVI